MDRVRIFLTGVGGQGTLTATTLLANTALAQGLEVVSGEIHGMAQRGGVVESTVLIGGYASPRIGHGEKYPELEHIKAVVGKQAKQAWFLPCRELGLKAGSSQSGNTALLGAACAVGVLPFGVDALEAAVRKFLPAKLVDINLGALALGVAAIKG